MEIPPTRSLFAGLALLLTSCGCLLCDPPATMRLVTGPTPRTICGPCDDAHALTLRDLGSSGFLITYGGKSIMTGPLLTNPRWWQLLLDQPAVLDTAYVDSVFATIDGPAVRAILIGHEHFDHFGDVPHIAERWTPNALIYGGPAMGHMIANDPQLGLRAAAGPRFRVIPRYKTGTIDRAGTWYYTADSAFRFMAVVTHHPNNFDGWMLGRGTYRKNLRALPTSPGKWLNGDDLEYLIDVLERPDSGTTARGGGAARRIAFRLFYTDAPGVAPDGVPPRSVLREGRSVDIAILCVGSYNMSRGYPDSILSVARPRFVVLSHWEDFFLHAQQPKRHLLILTNVAPLLRTLYTHYGDSSWVTPDPPSGTIRYCQCGE